MAISDLLILYCPGTRGDFLASILTDTIDQFYQQYAIKGAPLYYKLHELDRDINPWHEVIKEVDILKYRSQSIRIKISPDDYKFIARLAANKKLLGEIDESYIDAWEHRYRKLDIKFKYVVWFSDLFDVEFLKDFYQKFNGRVMPEEYVPLIKYNIDLQFQDIM